MPAADAFGSGQGLDLCVGNSSGEAHEKSGEECLHGEELEDFFSGSKEHYCFTSRRR